MAINFLNNISLNKNQLEQARIENLATDPASGVLGQIIFNTTSNVLKVCTVESSLSPPVTAVFSEVGGGVITVDTGDSTFINLADSGTAADPILTASLSATGTTDNTTFLRGDNTWSLISAIPGTYTWTLAGNTGASQLINSGNTASILGTGVITTAASATDTITITHSNVTRTNTTSSASPAFGATFTAVDSVTSSAQGHITAVNLKTVTLPANPNTNTTYTLPVAAGGANTAVINLTAGGSGSGVASSVTFSGTTNEIEVTETIGNNGTITIGLPNNVVIAETLTTGGNVTINTTGTSNNLKLVSTDTTVAGAPDLVLFADAAAQNGDTLGSLLFQGKNGMVPSSEDPLTYAGLFAHMADASNNHSVLALTMHKGNGSGAQDTAMNFSLIGNNNSAEGALYINPPSSYAFPSYNLEVNGTSRFVGNATFNSPVTIPLTPIANTDAASKNYVDASNVGQSVFQGGYNAATNTPDLDVAPSALIKKGWFWAVTNTGVFFSETVQPGDLLYANVDNPGATFANWVVVQSGQDIAGEGATDGATVKGVAGFNSAHFNVTANGWVSSDIYAGGSNLGIVPSGGAGTTFLRGDGTWVVPSGTYILPVATSTTLGGVELFSNTVQTVAANAVSATASRSYGVQLNSAGQAVVNVPWTDNTPVTSVSASTVNNRLGLAITPTTGAVVAGLSINTLADITTGSDAADSLPIYDLSATTNKRITLNNLTAKINAATSFTNTGPATAGTSYTIAAATHGLGSDSSVIMVQLVLVATGETVYADVTRGAAGLITITFAQSQAINTVRALLQKIG
jgi:hypothetical protein